MTRSPWFVPLAIAVTGRAQSLGLRLDEIGAIIAIADERTMPCEHLLSIVQDHLRLIAEQLASLHALERYLLSLRDRLERTLGAPPPDFQLCPCLDSPEEAGG